MKIKSMKNIYDKLSNSVSSKVMYEYSTSFYLSTFLLSKEMKQAIYSVYALLDYLMKLLIHFMITIKKNYLMIFMMSLINL